MFARPHAMQTRNQRAALLALGACVCVGGGEARAAHTRSAPARPPKRLRRQACLWQGAGTLIVAVGRCDPPPPPMLTRRPYGPPPRAAGLLLLLAAVAECQMVTGAPRKSPPPAAHKASPPPRPQGVPAPSPQGPPTGQAGQGHPALQAPSPLASPHAPHAQPAPCSSF